ncbi:hypothetical protein [Streptomyces sp. NPDC015131]|uniref:hypothetical protein n=1 Tax=Streptomyces sp. NPDC015131 TaxID=3364941 RepID=UPI003702C27D
MNVVRRMSGCAVAAAVARAGYAGLRRRRRGARWERTNFAGRAVDLYAGPAVTAGVLLGASAVRGPGRGPAVLAGLAAALCGAYDDTRGDHRRGFRAHLGALRHGEVTSGAVKLFGIGAAGLAAGALLRERAADKVLAGVVIAGSAHAVNLVDVRPGRAVLATLAFGLPRGHLAAVSAGAAAAVAADDLGERTMLGDMGAHALGAVLGTGIAASSGRAGLVAHAAVLLAAAARPGTVGRLAGSPGRGPVHSCE